MLNAAAEMVKCRRTKTLKRVSRNKSPSLPEELISEILLRVPVRSLLRFRCVCKSWKTLISDPQFAKDHLRSSIAHPNLANIQLLSPVISEPKIVSKSLQSLSQKPSSKPLCFTMNETHRILGSCNGLLCLIDSLRNDVTLWNPSIRITSKRFSTGINSSSTFITHYGFGYDHVNDTYKLLVAVKGCKNHKTVTKIFTLGANSWKVIPNFPCQLLTSLGRFVSCNSTLNWIAKRGAGDDNQMIFSFDLVTEKYGEVLFPDGNFDHANFSVVDALGERECLCISLLDSKKSHWVVWVMKEYGVQCSWTKLITIPTYIKGDYSWRGWCRWLNPLYLSEKGVVILESAIFQVVLYKLNYGKAAYPMVNLKGQDFLTLDDLRFPNMCICHESLVSPLC